MLDDILVDYADSILFSRGAFSLLVSALQFFYPRIRGRLYASFAYRTGWNRLVEIHRTVPMLRTFAYGIAKDIITNEGARMGIGLLVQFDAMLRTAELIAIRRRNVVLPEWHGYGNRFAYITLGTTKSGREQVAVVRDVYAVAALRYLVSVTAHSEGLLFDRSYQQYHDILSRACARLNLQLLGFTPHSPRAGSATQKILDGEDFVSVQEGGRWKCAESLRVYLDRAKALATDTVVRGVPFLNLLARPQLIGKIFVFSPITPFQ